MKEEINDKKYVDTFDPIYDLSSENSKLEFENRKLKETLQSLKNELDKFRTPPLITCEVMSLIEEKAIIRLPNQSNFLVNISQNLIGNIFVGDTAVCEQKTLTIIDKLDLTKNFPVENYVIVSKNIQTNWVDVGGLNYEKSKIREVLEEPLINPKKFENIGIEPPKGILLYGPPGTGKTLMAKALAKKTKATFIELVGSELVQKFIGEGAKLVKDLFELARKKAPSIIFIDEIDAIAGTRIETGTSGEREVQRTFMQLLGEIDGFKPLDNVKIIAATNRKDILDEAILRAGRLERHIEIKEPNKEGRIEILQIHTKKMKLSKNVNFEKIANMTENFSGADLKALTTEAGYIAINEKKKIISQKNFEKAIKQLKKYKKKFELNSQSFD